VRVDLSNGAAEIWFRRTGTLLGSLGVEPTGAVVVLVSDPLAIWLVSSPGVERQVVAGGEYSPAISDPHGVWFSNNAGLWLITPAGAVINVTTTRAAPAGSCL
jgi:hypothetical protein